MPSQNSKPYPWTCAACGKRAVKEAVVPYPVEGQHYSKQYLFTIPDLRVAKCESCGEIALTQSANAQISSAIRTHLGLLTPEEIRAGIETRHISQKQLAKEVDVAPETLSRWLSGTTIP